MSFALEFYSLSWEKLRTALTEQPAELIQSIKGPQWSKLLAEDDLGEKPHHIFVPLYKDDESWENTPWKNVDGVFRQSLSEIADVMSRPTTPDHIPPDISDNAALVVAAFIRTLGTRTGMIQYNVPDQSDSMLRLNFRNKFLDGVVGTYFKNHKLGEYLAARPMFGLYHLDFISWGGLTLAEMKDVMGQYARPQNDNQDSDLKAIEKNVDDWLTNMLNALQKTMDANADLVTLYRMDQEHYSSVKKEIGEEVGEDFVGKAGQWVSKLFLRP